MSLRFIVFAALALLLDTGLGSSASAQRVREKGLKSSFGLKPKSPLKLSVRADTLQQHSAKGLAAVLVIRNDSTVAITVDNPVDYLHMRLTDASGADVFFPHPSRLHFDLKRGGGSKAYAEAFRSYSITRVTINNKPSPVNLWISDAITIPAHGDVKVFLNITDMLPPHAPMPYTADQAVKVPAGKYSLSMSVGLAWGSRRVETFHADPITIHYVDKARAQGK